VRAAGGQLQVRSGARDGEEHAVIAVVIAKAADLGQPEAVAVERDQLVEAVGVAGNAQLHVAVVMNGRATLRVTDGCGHGLNSVTIAEYHGPRAALRRLFELAEDSAVALDDYIGAGDVLVAIDDEADAIVGHVQIVETARPDEGEIKNMAVEPARRHSGIGRALVASAVHHARERSQSTLTVATAAADIGNLRFYQRLGFRFRSVERDAFTPATGYPSRLQIDGIELRDRVWLELCVDP
jgi:ribosomal protein S18 acetylase RimI-like enzyme